MSLTQLAFYSVPAPHVRDEHVADLVAQTRERNSAHGVTGFLMQREDLFLQVLEGERRVLSRHLETLFMDDRHSNIVVLGWRDIDVRTFPEWDLGYINADELTHDERMLDKRSRSKHVVRLNVDQAVDLLERLSALVPGPVVRPATPTRLAA
ncbi:MAG: BLUF domain-containing protein [Phycisphaerales bacterium JB043]